MMTCCCRTFDASAKASSKRLVNTYKCCEGSTYKSLEFRIDQEQVAKCRSTVDPGCHTQTEYEATLMIRAFKQMGTIAPRKKKKKDLKDNYVFQDNLPYHRETDTSYNIAIT